MNATPDVEVIYRKRFAGKEAYRRQVWGVLCDFFSRWIPSSCSVLDLGAGYCEFINAIEARQKFAMDLNPDTKRKAAPDVTVVQADCSRPWGLGANRFDAIFTSNFFEHLPDKLALESTLRNSLAALRPGGVLLAMGPNIKFVPGAYWDFFDHFIPLTERSLSEVLRQVGFDVEFCAGRFLPYTMSDGATYPLWTLRAYLALPFAWRFFGKQFLVVARKPED